MRIVLDAFWWVNGTQSLKHVVHGLTHAWCENYPDDEVIVVVRRRDRYKMTDLPPRANFVTTRMWPQALSAMISVPWHARRTGADAMLAHNFTPIFGKTRGVYIQDVMFATNPEWFTRAELLYFRWMTRSARRSHILFSSTETEGKRIAENTNASRIVKAGMGVSRDVIDAGEDEPTPHLREGQFVLAVGRLNVRKNLISTLEGAKASGLLNPAFPLVIVGKRDGEMDSFPEWVSAAEDVGEVIFTGFVTVPELSWLIKSCALYICLSLDEGFGLPPVEARILGATVLVSDIPVFRETLGTGEASFVDPMDIKEIGRKIHEIVDSLTFAARRPSARLLHEHSWPNVVAAIRNELLRNGAK